MATSKSPARVRDASGARVRATDFFRFSRIRRVRLVLFLYVPAIVVLAALASSAKDPGRDRRSRSSCSTLFVLYWFVTTSLLRYALLFYPLLALCVGMLLVELAQRMPRAAPLAVAVAIVAALAAVHESAAGRRLHSKRHPERRARVRALSRRAGILDANDDGYADEQRRGVDARPGIPATST